MAIENKWNLVPPQSFTADGTQFGQITLANTAGFFTKQSAYLTANGLPNLPVQIKRVLSPTTLIVGTINNSQIGSWPPLNISAYTVALGAAIGAQIQPTNNVAMDDIFKAVYQSDPTVALRVIFTDQYGNVYSDQNPLPATFSGSISIGSVEIRGPSGDILVVNPDGSINVDINNDVTIAGGEIEVVGPTGNILNPNPDGSINVVIESAPSSNNTVVNTYNEIVGVAASSTVTLVTYTVPTVTYAFLQKATFSGENIARYDIFINGEPQDTARTMFGSDLTGSFDFTNGTSTSGLSLSTGDIVTIQVYNVRPSSATFEGRIQVLEIT